MKRLCMICLIVLYACGSIQATSGYELWMEYHKLSSDYWLKTYRSQLNSYCITGNSATSSIIDQELSNALQKLLDQPLTTTDDDAKSSILITTSDQSLQEADRGKLRSLGKEGFMIQTRHQHKKPQIVIVANEDIGLLYGTFHLIRLIQTQQSLKNLNIWQRPELDLRVLNHWDNLDRTSERGYAGFSIWDWHRLPDYLDPRYTDYARANASLGINGTVLTNVNANALVLTPLYLEKVKALADVFRPYGIKVYLTARFSAPMEIGSLKTADPLNEEVVRWWQAKAAEIYQYVPDFGGFLVKANSEGQPGPQNYNRSHADGANMLADALAPYHGTVMWRAFVYSADEPDDRAKQAFNEFNPLDGEFRKNVLLQVKNGPIDFQPREPFHPLFGAMPKTPLMPELQITQEYLGQATNLVYLAPMWKEFLDADTYTNGKGSQLRKIINGSLNESHITGMAGVANTGTDINWTGHPFAQSNWYAFGRLAWNTDLSSEKIADEWIRMTYSNDEQTIEAIKEIMLPSWETTVSYMTPLGLHHLMATNHHYGPGPWVDNLSRADWNPVYYHKADDQGIGFDRSASGSNAVAQYSPELAQKFGSTQSCPEKFILWFHHLSWDQPMSSGKSLWEELAYRYQNGVARVQRMQANWDALEPVIDRERFTQVQMLLRIQQKEAIWWKNASMLYFQTFAHRELPSFFTPPTQTLEHYQSLEFRYAPGIKP